MIVPDVSNESDVGASAVASDLVILLACSPVSMDPLHGWLRSRPRALRLRFLLYATRPEQLLPGQLAHEAGFPVHLLLGETTMPAPDWAERVAVLPPGAAPEEAGELMLALSDVLLMDTQETAPDLATRAAQLDRLVLLLDGTVRLPETPPLRAPLDRPIRMQGPWAAALLRVSGRIEQSMLETLAFRRHEFAPGRRSFARSRGRLLRCAGRRWGFRPYFAPDIAPSSWAPLCPDQAAVDLSAPVVAGFDDLDRQASFGASLHRDAIWLVHAGSAFAVFAAVAGAIGLGHPAAEGIAYEEGIGWAVAELVALLTVAALVWRVRTTVLQERWTGRRFAAEQLRVARLCLPLLMVPKAMLKPDHDNDTPSEAGLQAAKGIVRQQGLPDLSGRIPDWRQALDWVTLIVSDQALYHHDNHEKLERAEHRLSRLTLAFFAMALLAVLLHFVWHAPWLLLFTAVGPALAAALHGAATRLSIGPRAQASSLVAGSLETVRAGLNRLRDDFPTGTEQSWIALRALTRTAVDVMGGESERWNQVVRVQADDLPA